MSEKEKICHANNTVVLLVEDDELLRGRLSDALFDASLHVLKAWGAEEAMKLLEERDDIDAVITDIEMPGLIDGLELAAIVRRNWPNVAVVIGSSCRVLEDAELPKGAVFHSKPYKLPTLVASLRDLVSAPGPSAT